MAYPFLAGLVVTLMAEVEELRSLGVRRTAAVGLVAERHDMTEQELDDLHFRWLMIGAGLTELTVHGLDAQTYSM